MFPPTKVENIEENSRERVDWTRMFNTNSSTSNPPILYLAAWSILHQEEVKPPKERTSSCYCRGGANCYPNVIGPREVGANFKHARIVPPVVSDFRLLSLQGLAWRGSFKFCHLPFASTALQFTIRLWIVRRIRRDKLLDDRWACVFFESKFKKVGSRKPSYCFNVYILYFNEDISHGKKSRSFLLNEVVYDWWERAVFICIKHKQFSTGLVPLILK